MTTERTAQASPYDADLHRLFVMERPLTEAEVTEFGQLVNAKLGYLRAKAEDADLLAEALDALVALENEGQLQHMSVMASVRAVLRKAGRA